VGRKPSSYAIEI